MMGQDIEHSQSIFNAATGGDLLAQHYFFAVIVRAGIEEERAGVSPSGFAHQCVHGSATAAWLKDGPTGEATRYFLHVFLYIAAVNAERMQFHQLARVVFVNAASLLLRA